MDEGGSLTSMAIYGTKYTMLSFQMGQKLEDNS